MEFFRNTSFDFMRLRRVCLGLSTVAVVAALGFIFSRPLNLGIDFASGTQMIVQFAEPPDVQEVRGLLEEAGIESASIQSFGTEEDNSVILRTSTAEDGGGERTVRIEEMLQRHYNSGVSGFDLNRQGTEALASLLLEADPDDLRASGDDIAAREHYRAASAEVMAHRRDEGLIKDWSAVQPGEALSEAAVAAIRERATFGNFAVLSSDNVLPQIGSELRRKGLLAIAFALAGILAYIWFRFELRFGIGALAALAHDVAVCLGLFAFAGYEFNLTTVAAFLTVIGYSVNDSVVVFDRVRENLRRNRRESLVQVLNRSLNQTLSRTALTSGTTLLAVGSLFILGGDVIRGFSFLLLVGVLVGTYSSIYVASPIVLIWESSFGRERRQKRAAAA
ncbi:MAG: protein translocase subunit SecF [Acidobacteria bacterium]|nr:protein translocase subunit SecF [Acidobacteriota bacterium]